MHLIMKKEFRLWISAILIGVGIGSMACGCSRKVYVPVESVRCDTLRVYRERVDSIVDRDTVCEVWRGDTVIREVSRWRWRVRQHTDTLWRSHTDTVRITVPIQSPSNPSKSSKKISVRTAGWLSIAACIAFTALLALLRMAYKRFFP